MVRHGDALLTRRASAGCDTMRKRVRLALAAVAVLLIALYAAPEPAARESGAPYPEVVRVGVFDYGGYLEDDGEGNVTGYGYEYLEEIANYTGWRYEFVSGTWRELLRKLADGEIDLLSPAQYSAERARLYDFSKYECGMEDACLFVNRNQTGMYYGDLESLQGLRVAMIKGDEHNGRLEQYAREQGFTIEELYYDTWGETRQALEDGEADARLSGSLRHSSDEKVVLKLSPEPFYFITTKGNKGVLSGVNYGMEEIRTWDYSFNQKLYEKYYGSDLSNQLAFTREEADCIESRGTLRVAYNTNWPPLIYQDESGPAGALYELLRAVESKSGLTLAYVPAGSMEEMEGLVQSGDADCICYYPRDRLQAAREEGLQLTKAYISVPLTLVWRQGMTTKDLHKVALPKSQMELERVVREAYPDAEIWYYRDVESCLKAVQMKAVDGAFENAYILTQHLKNYEMLESVPTTFQYPLSIAIASREDPALLTAFNKVISQFTQEEINSSILNHTVTAMSLHNSLHFLRRYLPIAIVLAICGMFLLVFKSKRTLERHAYIDPLTGCMNQTKFIMEVERRIRDKCDGRYAILCFDIDRFKVINDLHGYRSGNALLQDIARTLKAHLKSDELFCRSAGDNYVLLLDNQANLEQRAGFLLERVCDTSQGIAPNLRFTVSAGIYILNEPVDGLHIAIDRANLARQSIKGEHQMPLALYTGEMRQRVLREQELENRLEGALANREFQVYYQPKFTVDSGSVVGAEALVRWRTPDGTMVFPDEFIPVFENNGTIIKLDLYVFRRVCEDLRRWLDEGYWPYPISVNLSRVHLYQSEFYEEYLEILRRYQIPSYLVELELTESTMFENQQQLVRVMECLKSMGILISMDDFGSGYSSLNLLKDLPIDSLKIDRAFFNESADTQRGQKIINSVVSMARQLDILVVSEGVETQEHVDFLRKINCQVAQGFYFSRPLPVEAFEELVFHGEKAGEAVSVSKG